MTDMTISRRKFIRNAAMAASAVSLAPWSANITRGAARSRVVFSHTAIPEGREEAVRCLHALDRGMEALLQRPVREAWASLFSSSDVVGLKVSCLAGRKFSTHVALVQAICTRLEDIGLKKGQIIIWDRLDSDLDNAGFVLNRNPQKILCMGNDAVGYSRELYEYGSACSRLSRLVTERCTAIINLPVLKDHGIVGISAGLKNFFGAIDNPNKYHVACGDPYVADVNMFAPLRDKVRLTICDAMLAQYEGGPPYMRQWNWPYQKLLLTQDMVALDRLSWNIIAKKRRQSGLPSLEETGRTPGYIHTAALHGLGNDDMKQIEVVET